MSETVRLLVYLVVIATFVAINAAYLVWVERKGAGRFQRRPGPTEVGWAGLLQPIAVCARLASASTSVVVIPARSAGKRRAVTVATTLPSSSPCARSAMCSRSCG